MQTENNHQGVDDRKPHAAKSPLTKYVLFGEMGEQLLSHFLLTGDEITQVAEPN